MKVEKLEKKTKEIKQQNVISFRLNRDDYKSIIEIANKVQMGPNEYAKAYVLGGIDDKGALTLYSKRFDNLEKMIKVIGLDLVFSVQKLLSYTTEDDIKSWLKDNMKAVEWNVKED